MTHKIITVWTGQGKSHGRAHAGLPYAKTETPFDRSVADIKGLLRKFKCDKIVDFSQTATLEKIGKVELTTIGFEKDGLQYRIDFPITFTENSQEKRLNMDVSGRIIHNRIKAQLTDLEIGYLTFHEAMFANLAIPSPEGTRTILEVVQDQLPAIKRGSISLLQLMEGGNR
jgi:hypothetical protein